MKYSGEKAILTAVVICSAAVALWWMLASSAEKAGASETLGQQSAEISDSHAVLPAREKFDASRLSSRMRAANAHRSNKRLDDGASRHPFPDIPLNRKGLSLEEDPFGANSIAEQAWLDRNGYPNAVQMQQYTVASDDILRMAADAGDEVAKVYLDFRNFEQGVEGAEDALLNAAMLGNSFALEMLSAYHSGSKHGDPLMGYALSRVLELQGNYTAGLMRDFSVSAQFTAADRMIADVEALEILNFFIEFRKQNYIPPVDPRPTGG